MAFHKQTYTIAGLLGITLLVSGCPDSEARWNEFLDATKDERPDGGDGDGDPTGDGDGDGDAAIPNMNGTFLFALTTSLGPDTPLQFATTVSNMEIAEDGSGATADFSFRPLTLDVGATTTPRECLPDSLDFTGVEFDANGNFEIDMGLVMVSGTANPVTGSDIQASLTVLGHIAHKNAICGELMGMLMSPLEYNLDGSEFGAIRLGDDGCTSDTLPLEFPFSCDTVPPPDTSLPDMNGTFLFALTTSLGPDTPLQFVTTVDFTPTAGGGGTADFTFQPLSLDVGATITPREFVGDPLAYPDIAIDADGNYEIDMGLVMVTGAANPVTGSDIQASLVVTGSIVHADAFCGELSGMLMSPLEYNLDGSEFAAMRLADDGSNPATLPTEFPYRCDMVSPAGG
jgi:hypothetical protein